VLGQRVFANPSNGALQIPSGRQSHSDAPFHFADGSAYESQHYTGGVLRSSQGQAFGKKVLLDRINQLNDIQTASQSFITGSMTDNGLRLGTDSMVMSNFPQAGGLELNLLLQSIIDATMGGDMGGEHLNRLDMSNCFKAITLVFRSVPTLQNDEITDILAKVDLVLTNLQGLLDPDENTTLSAQTREIALSLDVLFTKLKTYLEKMMATNGEVRQTTFFNPLTQQNETQDVLVPTDRGTTLSPSERAKLSSNLITSLGFSKLLRWNPAQYNDLLSTADRDRLMSPQQRQSYRSGDFGVDGDGDDQDDDDRFDRPGRPREDTQHDDETGRERNERDFDPDHRDSFGFNSGLFFNPDGDVRGQNTYFGEEAPLMERGYEDNEALNQASRVRMSGVRDRYRAAKNEDRTRVKRALFGSEASSTVASESTNFRTPSIRSEVVGRFDPDTQAFNVGYAFVPSTVSSRRSTVSPTPSSVQPAPKTPAPRGRKPKTPKAAKPAPAPTPALAAIALPTKMSEVPTDMGTLLRIANSAGIRVNKKADGSYGKANNIRRNIILKLGLAGKR
jgi:hypothetical protein